MFPTQDGDGVPFELTAQRGMDRQRERQLSWGMRIASFLGAVALAASAILFFSRIRGHLATPVQVAILIGAPALLLAATDFAARREKSGYFAALTGLLAFTAFFLNVFLLERLFNVTPSLGAFLAYGLFGLVLAYAYGGRLILFLALASLAVLQGAWIITWTGTAWTELLSRPEVFFPAGLIFFAVPLAVSHRSRQELAPVWRDAGLIVFLWAVLSLTFSGDRSFLRGLGQESVENAYQILGLTVGAGAIWLGIGRRKAAPAGGEDRVKRWGLLGGLAVIALVNAVILGGVAWNRSGVPEARIELTERELEVSRYLDPEDSALSLSLVLCGCKWSWFDREKLRELGFDVRVDPTDSKAEEIYGNVLARDAFVVLQMEGDVWRREIAEQERELRELEASESEETPESESRIGIERGMLERARRMGSRLTPVDAGLDPELLRGRYPDRSRYLVLPARLGLWHLPGEKDQPARLTGVLQGLLVEEVHVPRKLRPLLDEVRRRREPESHREMQGMDVVQTPLYRATLTVGRRYEPRLVSIEPIVP